MQTEEVTRADELRELGFSRAADKLLKLSDKKRKLAIAYEHYRFVRQEKIDAFNQKLRKDSLPQQMKQLDFTPIGKYEEIPSNHVLASLAAAKQKGCFDGFEIAHIVEVKDPILFGRVNECSDRFFIDQWDEDVKIEDILMPNEG